MDSEYMKTLTKLVSNGMHSCVSLLSGFMGFEDELNKKGEKMCYPNQEEIGDTLTSGIIATEIFFQIVVALTQSGKTGCMNALIKSVIKNPDNKIVPENIFVITGISSNDWVIQTKDRMPDQMIKRIFHRNDLKTLAKDLKGRENVLIIVDEVHIACEKKMSINKLMSELGYKDTDFLIKKNINFVEFSATPGAVLRDHKDWEVKGNAKILIMNPGEGYKGPEQLLNGRAFQWKKLDYDTTNREESIDAIKELKTMIEETYTSPRFHIIRAPKGHKFETVIERFKCIFETSEYDFKSCHSETEMNIDEILRNGGDPKKSSKTYPPPEKHTIIFIKETMRCAYTIKPKQNVGVLYERYSTKPKEHVIVQGMAGRACGYDVPDDMIVYTDLPSLRKYNEDWIRQFKDVKHYGKKDTAYSRSTFDIKDDETGETKKSESDDFEHKIFNKDREAIEWVYQKFKIKLHPSKDAPKALQDSNGKNPTEEYVKNRKWGLTSKKGLRKIRLIDNKICVYWRPSAH